ncbi:MAG: hypothetical protein MI976_27595 [Pseudomonadales bacterium]|nr:hypothetical protein [Pseudomonadales bacterium]
MAIELSNGLRVVWNWSSLLTNDLAPRIIDVSSNETLCHLNGHTDMIRDGMELSDGRLITWSNDQTLRVWDIDTGECQAVLRGHTEYIETVHELSDGLLVSFSNDQTFIVWDLVSSDAKHIIDINPWIDSIMAIDAEQRAVKGDKNYVRADVGSMIKSQARIAIVWERFTGSISSWDLITGSLIQQVSHRAVNTANYSLEQLFDLPGDYFASHCWLDSSLYVWCARTGKRQAFFKGRWDGLLGFNDESSKLKIFGYFHRSRHIECSLLDLASPHSSHKISIPGARVSLARTYPGGFALWTEDFRLLVFGLELQIIKTLPTPLWRQGEVRLIDPFSCHLSESELTNYIEQADSTSVKFYSPGESGPGSMQAHFFASPSCYDVRYFRSEKKSPDELVAEFSGWPGQENHNLFKYTSDSNKNLIFKDREGDYKAIDFQNPSNEAPFTLSNLPDNVGDAEFWDHVYCAPRSLLLSGGYVPNQSLTRLLSVKEGKSVDCGNVSSHWNLLNDRKLRVRISLTGDLILWNVEDKNSLSLIIRKAQSLSKPLPLIDSAHPSNKQCSLLINPEGALHLWYGAKPVALNNPLDGKPICVNPDTRRYYSTHFWDEDNRVCIIENKQIIILDAASGETLHTLSTPFDGGIYGVALVDGVRLIAWSRAELASWSAETFKPLYHLKDPGEWGPGYENVIPLKAGGVAYCSGCWSGDNRVVVWDGTRDLTVVHCHEQEVVALTELLDGSIISFSEADKGFYVKWRIL